MIESRHIKASDALLQEVHAAVKHGEGLRLALAQLGTTSELRRIEAERKLIKVRSIEQTTIVRSRVPRKRE